MKNDPVECLSQGCRAMATLTTDQLLAIHTLFSLMNKDPRRVFASIAKQGEDETLQLIQAFFAQGWILTGLPELERRVEVAKQAGGN